MKELLKRLLCVLMALAMVACLAACGATEEDDDEGSSRKSKKETTEEVTGDTEEVEETEKEEESLVGEWEAEIDMSDYISDMLYVALGVDLDVEDYIVTMTIKFKDNGTYKTSMDASKAAKSGEKIMEDLWPMLVDMVVEQGGVSEAQAEAALAAEGLTKESLMEQMDIEGAVEEVFADFKKGEWILDGDELYMAEEDPEDADPIEIEFDGDEFSIVGDTFTGDEDLDEYILPIVFERV